MGHDHGRAGVTSLDVKGVLHTYLQGARETLVWKLDGLSEYDMRRPLTATGTNLLGLVKHSAGTHLRYFGMVFGRAADVSLPWQANVEPNADFWAAPDESATTSSPSTGAPGSRRRDDHVAPARRGRARAVVGRRRYRHVAPRPGARDRGDAASCRPCRHRPGARRRLGGPAQRSPQPSIRRSGMVARLPRPGRSSRASRQRKLTARSAMGTCRTLTPRTRRASVPRRVGERSAFAASLSPHSSPFSDPWP